MREDGRVRLISYKDNKGVSYARNKGIDSAIGKYLFFLDSDDMIHPDLLEAGLEQAEAAGADILLFQRFFSDEHTMAEWEACCAKPLQPEWHTLSEKELWETWGALKRRYDVGGKFYLREAVAGLRFDEQLYSSEDYLFNYCFLTETPRTILCTDLPGYYYRFRGDSAWHSLRLEGLLQTLEARRRIIEGELKAGREENAAYDEAVCVNLIREWYVENGKNDKASAEEIKKFIREDRNWVLFQKIPRRKRWSFFLCINYPGLFRALKSEKGR